MVSLRTLLATAVVGAATLLPSSSAATDELHTLRLRWRDFVLGTGFPAASEPFASRLTALGAAASDLRDRFDPADGQLWADLPYIQAKSEKSKSKKKRVVVVSAIRGSFSRLLTMAQAWAQPGTGLTNDSALVDLILQGVDRLQREVYHANQEPQGNWWHWQVGIPKDLGGLCALLHDQLGATRIAGLVQANDHFVPDSLVASYEGTSTGANRADLCRSIAFSGVFGNSSARLAKARDALSPIFPIVTSGDGFYADGSFIQHGSIPYTGTYGCRLLGSVGELLALLNGSSWAITDPMRQGLFDAVDKSFAPVIHNGLVMDGVSGRAVSRGMEANDAARILQNDHLRGHEVIESILLLAAGAPPAESARWKSMVKGWMARGGDGSYSPFMADPRLSILARLSALDADESVPPAAVRTGHHVMARMDRVFHHRPSWAASVSMSSQRTSFYETGNGENVHGWHTSNGMLYWWGSDYGLGQFSDSFWPTVDPYRLPGTTVSLKRLADAAGGPWGSSRPNNRWAGGATDGEFAVIGQGLRGLQSSLVGRKSWLFLDTMVVCLGAAIASSDPGAAIISTYDNRNLGADGTHELTVDGVVQLAQLGANQTLTAAKWAHIDGVGSYLFLDDGPIMAQREARSGSWRDINTGGSPETITRRYLTLYRQHGVKPTNGSYAYAILPGATIEQTQAAIGNITIIENSPNTQAIRVGDVFAANFYTAGSTGDLQVSKPCSVLIRGSSIYVADPQQKLLTIDVTWKGVNRTVRFSNQAGTTVKISIVNSAKAAYA